MGSWFLKHLLVRDVQTNDKFIFIADKWFAVEEGDGQVMSPGIICSFVCLFVCLFISLFIYLLVYLLVLFIYLFISFIY